MTKISKLSLFLLAAVPSVNAGIVQISLPDASYLASTTKFAFGTNYGDPLDSLNSGSLTLSFSQTQTTYYYPGGWSTWSSTPEAEGINFEIAYNNTETLTLTLSNPVSILGFEIESNSFGVYDATVTYFNGANQIGSITRSVDGDGGARLMAAQADGGDFITSVQISYPGSGGFGAAQFRFAGGAAAVPEPGSAAVNGVIGSALIASMTRRKRRTVA
jgi:hypothetical protein